MDTASAASVSTTTGQANASTRPPIPTVVIIRKNNNNGLSPSTNSPQSPIYEIKTKNVISEDAQFKAPLLRHVQRDLSANEDDDPDDGPGTSEDGDFVKASRIRKRRYSQARIQPTRIKKVMQSDEDIGRMVASVPVGIGSAMEVFAEKLLLGSAEAVHHSSTKTLSPMHIKMAVSRNPHFAFLGPLLSEVQTPRPTLGLGPGCGYSPNNQP